MNLDDLTTRPAVFSPCRTYRYSLRRDIGGKGAPVLFIMLNPSTADETQDDPTIRRCMGFAAKWGASVLYITNLFALRATNPAVLRTHPSPVDTDDSAFTNDSVIALLAQRVFRSDGRVVAAWGAHGEHRGRGREIRRMFQELPGLRRCQLHHLGLTKHGHPRHPLYLRGDTDPEVWA